MLAASCGVSQQCFCGATTSLLAASIVLGMSSRSEMSAAGQYCMMLALIWC